MASRKCVSEDDVDAKRSRSDKLETTAAGKLIFEPPKQATQHSVAHDFVYKMDHPRRGVAVIINNKEFLVGTGMGPRPGTDVDAARLTKLFKRLGFETKLANNLSCADMKKQMDKVGHQDFKDADCFVLAILSHGDYDVVYGTDGIIPLEDLLEPLKKCPTLVGKPKLFFIQACRGYSFDDGVEVTTDQVDGMPASKRRIPREADVLLACSTVPGFYSWRNAGRGSWFVQAICDVFEEYSESLDSMEVMQLMTRVINRVAFDFESCSTNETMAMKKQCPSITTQLTKELYFKPKSPKN